VPDIPKPSPNDKGNRAAATGLDYRKTRQPPLRLTALLGWNSHSAAFAFLALTE